MKHTIGKLLATCIFAAGGLGAAQAQDLKIGMVLPLSGPFASTGQQMVNGARLYLQEHGDTVAGRKIVLIEKDDTGVSPSISKRQA